MEPLRKNTEIDPWAKFGAKRRPSVKLAKKDSQARPEEKERVNARDFWTYLSENQVSLQPKDTSERLRPKLEVGRRTTIGPSVNREDQKYSKEGSESSDPYNHYNGHYKPYMLDITRFSTLRGQLIILDPRILRSRRQPHSGVLQLLR